MNPCSLDTLLVVLQNAVMEVNASIRQRRQSLLHADDVEPKVSEQVLHVLIPQSPANDAPCDPVALPLRMFREQRMPQIAMLSIEFDCRLRFLKQSGRSEPQLHLLMGKPRFPWLSRRKLHHMRIFYLSSNAWQPQIEVNGRIMLLPYPAQTGAA